MAAPLSVEDFKPGDRVRVRGYDYSGEKIRVDGEEGTVDLDPDDEGSAYVSVRLDSESLTELVKVWLFTPAELVKI